MKTDVFEMPQKEFKGPLPNLLMLDAIQVLGFAAVTIGGVCPLPLSNVTSDNTQAASLLVILIVLNEQIRRHTV